MGNVKGSNSLLTVNYWLHILCTEDEISFIRAYSQLIAYYMYLFNSQLIGPTFTRI